MSITGFFRSIVNPEAMGEQIITTVQNVYETTKKLSPADDPHLILSMTYYSRIKARVINAPMSRKIDPKDPNINTLVMVESLLFSCLPEGHNVRALALKILQDERPDIWERYPKFEADAQMRISNLFNQLERGSSLYNIYKLRNPQLQIAHIQPHMLEMLRNGHFDHLL